MGAVELLARSGDGVGIGGRAGYVCYEGQIGPDTEVGGGLNLEDGAGKALESEAEFIAAKRLGRQQQDCGPGDSLLRNVIHVGVVGLHDADVQHGGRQGVGVEEIVGQVGVIEDRKIGEGVDDLEVVGAEIKPVQAGEADEAGDV